MRPISPIPQVRVFDAAMKEDEACRSEISNWLKHGAVAGEIAIFVREDGLLPRARSIVRELEIDVVELAKASEPGFAFNNSALNIGTMHQAKGLEFKSVVVLGCDDSQLPREARINNARDVDELNAIIETERHLLYVSATRARENLLITACEPGSEFLRDIDSQNSA